jgi:hypothetical protein
MSGGGKFRADAKLMQKPASATKPLQTLERVKGIEPSLLTKWFIVVRYIEIA